MKTASKETTTARSALTLLGACALTWAAAGCEPAPASGTIDLGEGRFQLALDPGVGTAPPAWLGGAVTWEYVGQATYVRPSARDLARLANNGDGPPTDTVTRLMATTMEDDHGRLFRPKTVDVQRLRAAVAAYNQRVARDVGVEPGAPVPGAVDGATDAERVPGRYTPLTWNMSDQDGDGSDDLFLWDAEDRGVVVEPLTSRQKKSVVYFFGDINSDAGLCTGTIIGDYWVVTAAHCAKDSTGSNWIYAEDSDPNDGLTESYRGKVCTRGNYYSGSECANVTARWGNGEWTGIGDMGDDLVVMKIDQPLGSGNYMALSQASDSTLKAALQYNLGFPGLTPSGASNLINCSALFTNDSFAGFNSDADAPCEMVMYWADGDCNHASSKVLGTRIDMSAGHSGGPIFYYPSGASPNAAHYLTAVVSGHHDGLTEDYNGGPKVPYHRDWIIETMDEN